MKERKSILHYFTDVFLAIFLNLLNKILTSRGKNYTVEILSCAHSWREETTWHLFNYPQWHQKPIMCERINSDTVCSFPKCLLLALIVFSLQLDEWAQLSALWPWHRNSVHPNRLHDSLLSPLLHCISHSAIKQVWIETKNKLLGFLWLLLLKSDIQQNTFSANGIYFLI